ncbi:MULTISPECIES: glycosyltransferase [unclassified Empedobacter]|uniref:glycosyltransferase family 2 protein n=1 Tax=unclassified Empedobacter TaxID=2643773 RepID=UPI0025B8832E|nr:MULTISPECIES: glycosyltransferase [unclassified Empedobacter]
MIVNPKVSILVPIYGVEKFIERCAISLFDQTFQDIEYIFVNDCTPDNSIDILINTLERYSHRKAQVKIINHDANKGLAGARNTGVQNASGDYILHVDSDDYLELNAIELLYNKAFEENSDIVVCDFIMEWPETSMKVIQNIDVKDKFEFLNLLLSGQTMTCVWNKLIKRDLYVKNSVRTIEGVNLGEDFTVIPKLVFYANSISKVNKYLYHYVQFNSQSYTKNINLKYINNLETVISSLDSFFVNNNLDDHYRLSLLECKLRKKLELIIKVNKDLISYVLDLYPETKEIEGNVILPKRDKITFFVMKKCSRKFIEYYSICFKFLFSINQKMKKR